MTISSRSSAAVWGSFAHAEVVEDKQRDGSDRGHIFFTLAIRDGVGQFVKQDVDFAVEHLIALQNGCLSDGLSQVALSAAAGGPGNRASSRLAMNAPVAKSKTKRDSSSG